MASSSRLRAERSAVRPISSRSARSPLPDALNRRLGDWVARLDERFGEGRGTPIRIPITRVPLDEPSLRARPRRRQTPIMAFERLAAAYRGASNPLVMSSRQRCESSFDRSVSSTSSRCSVIACATRRRLVRPHPRRSIAEVERRRTGSLVEIHIGKGALFERLVELSTLLPFVIGSCAGGETISRTLGPARP